MTTRPISPDLITHILFGEPRGFNFTQESPVLREIWLGFAGVRREARDVLMVPCPHTKATALYFTMATPRPAISS